MNDYERVARVIAYLEAHYREQPDLDRLAAVAGLSSSHFHRLFHRWAGTTPKAFLQHLTAREAAARLRAGESVLDTSLEVGLSGPGRLHDLCVKVEAASPGEIGSGGEGWRIRHGVADTPFGGAFIAVGPRGVCQLAFVDWDSAEDLEGARARLKHLWPRARLVEDGAVARETAREVFCGDAKSPPALAVLVRGTAFQLRVWRALVEIPSGETRRYGEVARELGIPSGARAVGGAVAANPVAMLIPCHRVIRAGGGSKGGYRWGGVRKRVLLAWEAASRDAETARLSPRFAEDPQAEAGSA